MTTVRNYLDALIDDVAANAGAAALTATVDLRKIGGNDRVQRTPVLFRGTFILERVAATNMTAMMSVSINGGVNYGRVQSINVAAGTGILSDYTPTKTQSSSFSLDLQMDVRCGTHIKVVLAAAGGGATDKITLLGAVLQEV